jgi:hypothetical protein
VELFSYGYGISVYDTNCGSNESAAGAGIARFASGFLVSDQVNLPPHGPYRGGEFSFVNWGANGERMICGDSGGPDYINWPVVSGLADTHLAGVHSGITWETPGNPGTGTSAFSGAWISQVVDGLYVYPASTGWNMKYGSNYTLTLGGTASPHFIYSNTYQRIYVDYDDYTMCLQKKSSNSQAELALCSGSAAQKWEVTSANRIRNPTNNTCLTENGSQVVVNTCVSSTASLSARKKQTWMFAGRPYDVEG